MTGYSFSPKQRTVLTWWGPGSPHREKEAIICDGAVRSGKTLAMGMGFFLWAMVSFRNQRFGICGKTIQSLRRNVLAEVLPRLQKMGFSWKEKRSENLLTLSFRGRENRFYIFGGRDESSASLIQGITFAGILMDEVALMPRSFAEQACARCSVTGSRLWFNCNPAGPTHWFYREWILEAEEKTACGCILLWRTTHPCRKQSGNGIRSYTLESFTGGSFWASGPRRKDGSMIFSGRRW